MPDGEPDRHAAALRPQRRARPRSTSWSSSRSGSPSSASTPRSTAMETNKLTNVILDGEFDAFEWGWYVEPDPDSMLSYLTCGQRGGWSDSWYCNEEYDALYDAAARRDGRRDARQDMVKQMQEILYRGRALPRHGVHHDRRGLPQRPVRLLPAAARPGRHLADPVRRPATTSTSARPTRPATATASSTAVGATESTGTAAADDEGVSTGVLIGGGVAAGRWSSVGGGRG